MNRSIDALKTRAKKLHKAALNGDEPALAYLKLSPSGTENLKRKTCLHLIARKLGFRDWNHTRAVLAGEAEIGQDMGQFWYSDRCSALLNIWFANYAEAKSYLEAHPQSYLLPFKTQYIAVDENFIQTIGLSDQCREFWRDTGNNAVASYASTAWHALAFRRIHHILNT